MDGLRMGGSFIGEEGVFDSGDFGWENWYVIGEDWLKWLLLFFCVLFLFVVVVGVVVQLMFVLSGLLRRFGILCIGSCVVDFGVLFSVDILLGRLFCGFEGELFR